MEEQSKSTLKPIESMTTAEMMEELRQRREYDTVQEPGLEELGRLVEAQGIELAVLRAMFTGQIVASVLVAGIQIPGIERKEEHQA